LYPSTITSAPRGVRSSAGVKNRPRTGLMSKKSKKLALTCATRKSRDASPTPTGISWFANAASCENDVVHLEKST
jgi:hypothetical protein